MSDFCNSSKSSLLHVTVSMAHKVKLLQGTTQIKGKATSITHSLVATYSG